MICFISNGRDLTKNSYLFKMQLISESYRNKLMSLAGINTSLLSESSRVDFLKKDFMERAGRKYDKFLKFYSTGNWSAEKEPDNFIKNIIYGETFYLKGHAKPILAKREEFVKIMTNKFFPTLEKADPTENKQYLNWLTNIFLAGNLPTEDIYKANEALALFQKNKEKLPLDKRNINSFTNLTTLFETVSQYSSSEEMSATEKEKIIKLEGAEQVYESPNWKIITPKTKEAACLYGKSTKWCTAAQGSDNRFDYYNKTGRLYILIDKRVKDDRNIMKKLQFHFKIEQFMDTLDHQINITHFFKANPELKGFFKKNGEINAGFEIEHMLVTKEEGLKLLKTTKNKIDLLSRRDFNFLKKFFIEIGASEEFKKDILTDREFIKFLFEKEMFGDLLETYSEFGVQEQGLYFIKSMPWLESWITNPEIKPEIIQSFIFSVSNQLGSGGKEFAKQLLKRGGIIWNAFLQPGKNKISHYFNMLSARQSLGASGLKIVKEMLRDPSVISELKSKGVSDSTISMLNKFYTMLNEHFQAHVYLRNILR